MYSVTLASGLDRRRRTWAFVWIGDAECEASVWIGDAERVRHYGRRALEWRRILPAECLDAQATPYLHYYLKKLFFF
jgi:hypothetical protein